MLRRILEGTAATPRIVRLAYKNTYCSPFARCPRCSYCDGCGVKGRLDVVLA